MKSTCEKFEEIEKLAQKNIFYSFDKFKHTNMSKNSTLVTFMSFVVAYECKVRKSP